MKSKQRVGVLFGGQSAEHEVSLLSARSVMHHLDQEKYQVVPIAIDREGNWHLVDFQKLLCFWKNSAPPLFDSAHDFSSFSPLSLSSSRLSALFDILFPVLHGPFGEDGTVQGVAQLFRFPLVGSEILGSALCMNKIVSKKFLQQIGLPVVPFLPLYPFTVIDPHLVVQKLGLPLFVKPAEMGSSIGVSKVEKEEDLLFAIEEARLFSSQVVVEKAIVGREIECAVLGNENPKASLPGEIITREGFYDYQAKYEAKDRSSFQLPALLSKNLLEEVQRLAVKAFLALECKGMARVDFFLSHLEELFVSEVNTIPGFTEISLYPKLWELEGLSFSRLLDRLIELGWEQFANRNKCTDHRKVEL